MARATTRWSCCCAASAERITDGSIFSVYHDNNPWLLLVLVLFSMLLKVVATSITVGGGGNGGMFGSSLFSGALAGFFFARLINLSGLVHIPEVHFVVLGMAGHAGRRYSCAAHGHLPHCRNHGRLCPVCAPDAG